MIEHQPWIGSEYPTGIRGQRIAIVGYSHHHPVGSEDDAGSTVDCVSRVMSREYRDLNFFNSIRNYFGSKDHKLFWPQVMFFNFVPDTIGTSDERFAYATGEQVRRGVERLHRILSEHRPHKMLVFTKKGWDAMPATREDEAGKKAPDLGPGLEQFTWGTYAAGDSVTAAFGLRHPQGAPGDLMRRAVEAALSTSPVAH